VYIKVLGVNELFDIDFYYQHMPNFYKKPVMQLGEDLDFAPSYFTDSWRIPYTTIFFSDFYIRILDAPSALKGDEQEMGTEFDWEFPEERNDDLSYIEEIQGGMWSDIGVLNLGVALHQWAPSLYARVLNSEDSFTLSMRGRKRGDRESYNGEQTLHSIITDNESHIPYNNGLIIFLLNIIKKLL